MGEINVAAEAEKSEGNAMAIGAIEYGANTAEPLLSRIHPSSDSAGVSADASTDITGSRSLTRAEAAKAARLAARQAAEEAESAAAAAEAAANAKKHATSGYDGPAVGPSSLAKSEEDQALATNADPEAVTADQHSDGHHRASVTSDIFAPYVPSDGETVVSLESEVARLRAELAAVRTVDHFPLVVGEMVGSAANPALAGRAPCVLCGSIGTDGHGAGTEQELAQPRRPLVNSWTEQISEMRESDAALWKKVHGRPLLFRPSTMRMGSSPHVTAGCLPPHLIR